jgi:hypothetical protein
MYIEVWSLVPMTLIFCSSVCAFEVSYINAFSGPVAVGDVLILSVGRNAGEVPM